MAAGGRPSAEARPGRAGNGPATATKAPAGGGLAALRAERAALAERQAAKLAADRDRAERQAYLADGVEAWPEVRQPGAGLPVER